MTGVCHSWARRRAAAALMAGLVLPGAGATASLTLRYDFSALSLSGIDREPISGGVSIVALEFVDADVTFAVADLLSCAFSESPAAPASCQDAQLLFGTPEDDIGTSFDARTQAKPANGIETAPTAFSTPGAYATQVLGADQAGKLVAFAVPEPAPAATLLAGLAVLGLYGRRVRLSG